MFEVNFMLVYWCNSPDLCYYSWYDLALMVNFYANFFALQLDLGLTSRVFPQKFLSVRKKKVFFEQHAKKLLTSKEGAGLGKKGFEGREEVKGDFFEKLFFKSVIFHSEVE